MKLSLSIFKPATLMLAILLVVFQSFGMASASDFPRGLYGSPDWQNLDEWVGFDSDSLHHNFVWNYGSVWEIDAGITVDDYLDSCTSHGLKSVLRKGDWGWNNQTEEDSIPYFVEYYSYGNYNQLQVDWNYDEAVWHLDNDNGRGYYYWQQAPGTEVQPIGTEGDVVFWSHAESDTIYNHKFIHTPRYTDNSAFLVEPEFDFRGQFGYINKGRTFCARVRLMIDTTGFGNTVDLADTVFKFDFGFRFFGDPDYYRHNWLYLTPNDFDSIGGFQNFWVEGYIEPGEDYHRSIYEFYYCPDNKVDIYVNWVEYMDKEQGYPLFSGDQALRNATLQQIATQCSTLQQSTYGDAIIGWSQSDEPIRPFFLAHGVVNDFFDGRACLEGLWPRTPFPPGPQRRCDHFFADGEPRIFEVEYYPFLMGNSIGNQVELDTLASKFEQVYETVGDSIPFMFTGQVHWHDSGDTITALRHPKEAEIFAQTYMALAHGAQGISFFKYSSRNSGGVIDSGLVDSYWEHPENTILDEKWQAVHDVFAQLDSLGNALLFWDLYAAYCAKDGGFQLPVQSIYFEDDDEDYIEVGQFSDASNDTFLIVVNRHTEADRHISIVTDLSGRYALRDLYTQEKFVSNTGNFEWIPFAAGQGRVFKLEPYIARPQVQNITLDR